MSSFYINHKVVLEKLGQVSSPVSGRLTISCPDCNGVLYVHQHDESCIFVCSNCYHAFDALLLFSACTQQTLNKSLGEIIHHGAFIGKANKQDVATYRTTVVEPLAAYNRLAAHSEEILKTGAWLGSHGKLLMSLGIYPGTNQDNTKTFTPSMLLWSSKFCKLKELGIRPVDGTLSNTRNALFVPIWSGGLLAGYWAVTPTRVARYATKAGETHGACGIAFTHDVHDYSKVVAANSVLFGIRAHCSYRSKLGIPAPVVIVSNDTRNTDFKTLDKSLVFVTPYNGSTIGILEPMLNAGNPAISFSSMALTGSESNSLRMVSAILEDTGFDLFKYITKQSMKTRRVRDMLSTCNLDYFVAEASRVHGEQALAEHGFIRGPRQNEFVVFDGVKIDHTASGYTCRTPAGLEKISNFTMKVERLYRYRKSNEIVADGEFLLEGQTYRFRCDYKDLLSRSPMMTLQTLAVDSGAQTALYVHPKWRARLIDVAAMFHNPQMLLVSDRVGWDKQSGFIFINKAYIDKRGEVVECNDDPGLELPVNPVVLTPDTWKSAQNTFGSLPFYLAVKTAQTILSAKFGITDIKPLVLTPRGSSKSLVPSPMFERLLRGGVEDLTYTSVDSYRRVVPSLLTKNSLLEMPGVYGYQAGALGLADVVEYDQTLITQNSDISEALDAFDGLTTLLLCDGNLRSSPPTSFTAYCTWASELLKTHTGVDFLERVPNTAECFSALTSLTGVGTIEELNEKMVFGVFTEFNTPDVTETVGGLNVATK